MEWEEELPFDALADESTQKSESGQADGEVIRLDCLLPGDDETNAASPAALRVYLNAMIELTSRHAQGLSLLALTVDETSLIKFFGRQGVLLIARAVARCLHQETRDHDVVARIEVDPPTLFPVFGVVCPLLNEEQAAALAERLRQAMLAQVTESERPWLGLSFGVASTSLDIADPDALIARACEALKSAQRNGGGKVWRHSDSVRRMIEGEEGTDDGPNPN